MARLNIRVPAAAVQRRTSAVRSAPASSSDGAPAVRFGMDSRSELFVAAVSSFFGEDAFYETGNSRNSRIVNLAEVVSAQDPRWMAEFIVWLRNEANMRTSAVALAAVWAHTLVKNGMVGDPSSQDSTSGVQEYSIRWLLPRVLVRADEGPEFLAFWVKNYGKNIPKPVKRGLADVMVRLNEYSAAKYSGSARTKGSDFTLADVIQLVHPRPLDNRTSDLLRHIVDSAYRGPVAEVPDSLPQLLARKHLLSLDPGERKAALLADPSLFNRAAMTWEQVAGIVPGGLDAQLWSAIAPRMPYMALLRNLSNIVKAGVGLDDIRTIAARISDPEAVKKSRQLPYRYLSAIKQVNNLELRQATVAAADISVGNIPTFPGETLILADVSGSMHGPVSARSSIERVEVAMLFAVAMARANGGSLVGFATESSEWDLQSDSILHETERLSNAGSRNNWSYNGTRPPHGSSGRNHYDLGHGTELTEAVRKHYSGQARIVTFTDDQAIVERGYPYGSIPSDVPVYSFVLGGYRSVTVDTSQPNRFIFSGWSDQVFKAMQALETAGSHWPWEREITE